MFKGLASVNKILAADIRAAKKTDSEPVYLSNLTTPPIFVYPRRRKCKNEMCNAKNIDLANFCSICGCQLRDKEQKAKAPKTQVQSL